MSEKGHFYSCFIFSNLQMSGGEGRGSDAAGS